MTKTICLSFISLLLISLITNGQKRNGYKPVRKSVAISPAGIIPAKTNLPFSKIEVIDSRLDTSKIGYMFIPAEHVYRKIITGGDLASVIQSSLNTACKDQLDATVNRTLIIVIKSLWLQETSIAELKKQKITDVNDRMVNRKFGMCTSFLETYALEDSTYTPLFRADTCFQSEKKPFHTLYADADQLLSLPFSDIMNKAASINVSKLTGSRKKLKWSDIKSYNDKRLAFPRFANDTLVRGIYLTFKDFMNNKPLVKEFIIDAGKVTDELYLTENGQKSLVDSYWGFCDGEKNYIRIGYNFFALTRQSNTYELWGTKVMVSKNMYASSGITNIPIISLTAALAGDAIKSGTATAKQGIYKPMQLNMETGEVY